MLGFDTETTGLLRPELSELHLQPSLIEIYVCKFDEDFKVYDEFESYVKPLLPIPEVITKITGIDDSMVKHAPSFIEIYDDLCDFFLGEETIFGHNASFDIDIVANELRRVDKLLHFPWPKNHLCTVELSQPINNKRMKLGDLYKLITGKEIQNAHRAKGDVLAMVECLPWLKENGFL